MDALKVNYFYKGKNIHAISKFEDSFSSTSFAKELEQLIYTGQLQAMNQSKTDFDDITYQIE